MQGCSHANGRTEKCSPFLKNALRNEWNHVAACGSHCCLLPPTTTSRTEMNIHPKAGTRVCATIKTQSSSYQRAYSRLSYTQDLLPQQIFDAPVDRVLQKPKRCYHSTTEHWTCRLHGLSSSVRRGAIGCGRSTTIASALETKMSIYRSIRALP